MKMSEQILVQDIKKKKKKKKKKKNGKRKTTTLTQKQKEKEKKREHTLAAWSNKQTVNKSIKTLQAAFHYNALYHLQPILQIQDLKFM